MSDDRYERRLAAINKELEELAEMAVASRRRGWALALLWAVYLAAIAWAVLGWLEPGK